MVDRQKINGYTDDRQENAFELRVVNLTGHFSVVVIAFDYMKQKTEQQCKETQSWVGVEKSQKSFRIKHFFFLIDCNTTPHEKLTKKVLTGVR